MLPGRSTFRLAELAVLKEPNLANPREGSGSIVQTFLNVNLMKSHRGLRYLADEFGINLDQLKPGQFVAFMNRKRNRIKLYAAGSMYVYLMIRDEEGVIDEQSIKMIPKAFGSDIDIDITPAILAALGESPALIDDVRERRSRLPVYTPPSAPVTDRRHPGRRGDT